MTKVMKNVLLLIPPASEPGIAIAIAESMAFSLASGLPLSTVRGGYYSSYLASNEASLKVRV